MALELSGTAQGLRFSTTDITATPFTISAWVKPDTLTTRQAIVSIVDSSVGNKFAALTVEGQAGDGIGAIVLNGVLRVAETSTSCSADTWHHACGVFASTTSRDAYLDAGGKVSNTQSVAFPGTVDRTSIGVMDDSTPSNYLNGSIAEVAIWSAALAIGEISALAAGIPAIDVRRQGLVFYAPLVRGSPWIDLYKPSAATLIGTPTVDTHPATIRRIFVPRRKASGGVFNKTASESFALSDLGSEVATFVPVSADSIVYADTSTETASIGVSVSESVVLDDTSIEVAVFGGVSADSFVITDESISQVGIFVTVDETFTFSDVSSETAILNAVSSESLSFADTGSELATFVRALAEALTLSDDSTGVLATIEKTATDALVVTDTASETATFARTVLEALTLTDSAAIATKVIGRLVLDAITFIDAASATGGQVVSARQRGGSSLSREQQRRLERLQMIQKDDEEIISLIMGILK